MRKPVRVAVTVYLSLLSLAYAGYSFVRLTRRISDAKQEVFLCTVFSSFLIFEGIIYYLRRHERQSDNPCN